MEITEKSYWISIENEQPETYDFIGILHNDRILIGMALLSMGKWWCKCEEGMIEIKQWQPAE